jgi:hypothetical protein
LQVRKRRKLLILSACLAVVIGIAAWPARENQPRYQGWSVSQWLMIYYESDCPGQLTNHPAAAAALLSLGTNAVPRLLEWIQYETPPWHRKLARVMPRRIGNSGPARRTLYLGFHRAEAARTALRLLGTNAAPAIPQLSALAADQSRPQTASRATEALRSLTTQPSPGP